MIQPALKACKKTVAQKMTEAQQACEYGCADPPCEICGVMRDGFQCTRAVGHIDQHAACGMFGHPHLLWDQEAQE